MIGMESAERNLEKRARCDVGKHHVSPVRIVVRSRTPGECPFQFFSTIVRLRGFPALERHGESSFLESSSDLTHIDPGEGLVL